MQPPLEVVSLGEVVRPPGLSCLSALPSADDLRGLFVAACTRLTRASLRLAPALSTWLWVAPLEKLAHSWVNLRKGAFSSAAICAFSFGSLSTFLLVMDVDLV